MSFKIPRILDKASSLCVVLVSKLRSVRRSQTAATAPRA